MNIIHNAEDIFRERKIKNREILIQPQFENGKLQIIICDNAGGIPKDILPKVFDPYFTTRHETQGTGLGLYMSRELIQKSFQGEIYVKNRENDGQVIGASFIIELPNFREI